MAVVYLFEGIVIGFILATPVGPIGILCVRNTVTQSRRQGIVVGLGGATADVLYATVALLGVKLISGFVADHQHLLRLTGSIVLLAAGFFTFRSRPRMSAQSINLALHARTFISTLMIAVTNPMTLVGYAAVFTMLGVRKILPYQIDVIALVVGVFAGSLLWFSVLSSLAHLLRERLTDMGLARVNRIAGSLLVILGMVAFLGGVGVF